MTTGPRSVTVAGNASDEEVAAIIAAIEALWPRAATATAQPANDVTRWRFSGRWWAPQELTRRPRPSR